MSTATGERRRLLKASQERLLQLPLNEYHELPGRPSVVYQIRSYASATASAEEAAKVCREDAPFLFRAFETGQVGPKKLAKLHGGTAPRMATIHEYLDWTVTAQAADEDDELVSKSAVCKCAMISGGLRSASLAIPPHMHSCMQLPPRSACCHGPPVSALCGRTAWLQPWAGRWDGRGGARQCRGEHAGPWSAVRQTAWAPCSGVHPELGALKCEHVGSPHLLAAHVLDGYLHANTVCGCALHPRAAAHTCSTTHIGHGAN